MQKRIEEALIKNKAGKHIHLGHPSDVHKSVEEMEEENRINLAITQAVFEYELKNGGLVVENGIYKKTDKCGSLPCYRDSKTMSCCLEVTDAHDENFM